MQSHNFIIEVDGVLGWQPWDPCSATCDGQRKWSRTCVPPHFGGAPCRGNTVETQPCGARHCPGITCVMNNYIE